MNRSHTFHALLLILVLTSMLPALQSTPVMAQTDNTIIIGTTDFPRNLDPADVTDYPSWELLTHLYTGLTRQVPGTLDFELALAADYSMSEDGLLHHFTVRDDATFDDGIPITAQTFADSINRIINQARPPAELLLAYVAEVTAEADNTVQFRLHRPVDDFLAFVALPLCFPVHPDLYPAGELLNLSEGETLITNGVYRLESFTANREVRLLPNPSYTGQLSNNDGIVLRRYDLPIDLRRALQAGEVDVAWRALALPDLEAIDGDETLVIEQQPNLQTYYMIFNQTPGSFNNQQFFDDETVRHAFALLIDRERATERGFEGTLTPLYSLLPAQLGVTTLDFPTYDWEQADVILESGGYRARRSPVNAGFYLSSDAYGDLMSSAFNELRRGIEESLIASVSFTQDDVASSFIRAVERGEYLVTIVGWRPLFPSPAAYLIPLAHSEARIPRNAEYGSEELDNVLAQAALAADAAERDVAYVEAQNYLLNDYTLLPLWQGRDTVIYREGVSGVLVEANSWLHYDLLSK